MTRNKKAMEMALGTVITIVILLLVLIIVGSYFLGGITKTGEDVSGISEKLAKGEEGGLPGVQKKIEDVAGLFNDKVIDEGEE